MTFCAIFKVQKLLFICDLKNKRWLKISTELYSNARTLNKCKEKRSLLKGRY